jgi:hypothetical protein
MSGEAGVAVAATFTSPTASSRPAPAYLDRSPAGSCAAGRPLGGDSLGPAGFDGDTYLEMLRHNTTTIVSNLSGA